MYALLAVLMLCPVTMPVPVLRGLVHERFGVSELATSLFMSINMVGALFAAPIAGSLADRFGGRRRGVVVALLIDAACFVALALDAPFWAFLAVRFAEGCAHITALSLLLSLAADGAAGGARSRTMGLVGAGLTLGVALGAPLGGVIGRDDALRPLYAGAVMLGVAAVLAHLVLAERGGGARRAGLGEIARAALADRALLVPLAFAFVDRFTVGFFTTTFPLYASRVLGASRPEIGFLLAAFLLPFSLLSYPSARIAERTSKAGFVVVGSLGYGVLLAGLGMFSRELLPFAMVGLGVLSAVMFVPSLTMLAELAAPGIRSTAMGGFNAAGSLGFLIGPLVGGAVSQGVAATHGWPAGYASAFAVAGAAMLVCVLATALALRRLVRSGRTR